ncbi:MAG: hypothetical protein CR972_01555 [Candidatus Moraniibacteriota bacterium]|nr:MAG: hypothetical protein CR972_01555 [Candidatus Moranbacteria bacterium]
MVRSQKSKKKKQMYHGICLFFCDILKETICKYKIRNMKTKKKIYAIFFVFTMFFFVSHNTHAQNPSQYKILEPIPGMTETNPGLGTYLEGLYNFAVGFVAVAALLMITIGGFYYIVSAGNQAQAGTAKKIVTDALLGLAVVFCTYLILHTINPELLKLDLKLDGLKIQKSTQKQISKKSKKSKKTPQNFSISHSNPNVVQKTTPQTICVNGKCYKSKAECIADLGQSLAAACVPAKKTFSDPSKFYTKDGNGKYTEYESEEACKKAGNTNCVSAEEMKSSFSKNQKTEQEIKEDIFDVEDTVARKAEEYSSDKTIEHMIETTEKFGGDVIDVDPNGASYMIGGDDNEERGLVISEIKTYAEERGIVLQEKESDDCNQIKCTKKYKVEFPADFEDSRLAGTTMIYAVTENIKEHRTEYGNVVVTAAQEIKSDDTSEKKQDGAEG